MEKYNNKELSSDIQVCVQGNSIPVKVKVKHVLDRLTATTRKTR